MDRDKISAVSETRLSTDLPEASITTKTVASEAVHKFKALFREELEKNKDEHLPGTGLLSDPDYQEFFEEFFDYLVNSSGKALMLLKNFGYGEALFYIIQKARGNTSEPGSPAIQKAGNLPVYQLKLSDETYSLNQVKYRDPAGGQYNDTI